MDKSRVASFRDSADSMNCELINNRLLYFCSFHELLSTAKGTPFSKLQLTYSIVTLTPLNSVIVNPLSKDFASLPSSRSRPKAYNFVCIRQLVSWSYLKISFKLTLIPRNPNGSRVWVQRETLINFLQFLWVKLWVGLVFTASAEKLLPWRLAE